MNNNFEPMYPGFIFLPMASLPNIGYGVVEIHIGATQIERFFDTRQAIFPIVEEGSFSQLVVEHPWLSEGSGNRRHVCAGRFSFYESDGDEHQGFSLGGELEVSQDERWVSCRFSSAAPMYNLQEDYSASDHWLVDEIEGVLARRRAIWAENENLFWDRLQSVNPFDLFLAVIADVKEEIQSLSLPARSSYQDQYDHIKHVIHILEVAGKWPAIPPRINDIL